MKNSCQHYIWWTWLRTRCTYPMSDKYRIPDAIPRSIPTSCIIVNIPSLFCTPIHHRFKRWTQHVTMSHRHHLMGAEMICPLGSINCKLPLCGSVVRTSVCGRRLSLTCAWVCSWQVNTLWVNCPLRVSQLGQLSFPTLRGRLMSSNPRSYIHYGVDTIKRHTRAMYECRPKSVFAGLGCGLDCTPALSHSALAAAVCGLWRYISAMPLPF